MTFLNLKQRFVFSLQQQSFLLHVGAIQIHVHLIFTVTSTLTSRRLGSTHSSESGELTVPSTETNNDDCSFAVQGPRMWNSLSVELCAGHIGRQQQNESICVMCNCRRSASAALSVVKVYWNARDAVLHLQFMAQSVPPAQIVIML